MSDREDSGVARRRKVMLAKWRVLPMPPKGSPEYGKRQAAAFLAYLLQEGGIEPALLTRAQLDRMIGLMAVHAQEGRLNGFAESIPLVDRLRGDPHDATSVTLTQEADGLHASTRIIGVGATADDRDRDLIKKLRGQASWCEAVADRRLEPKCVCEPADLKARGWHQLDCPLVDPKTTISAMREMLLKATMPEGS